MKLYHYNTELFDDLRSLLARGLTHETKRQQPNLLDKTKATIRYGLDYFDLVDKLDYDRNISFFTSPIPLNIASIYQHIHEFWKKGLELYQYEVSIDDLPHVTHFRLVESPEKTKLILKQDWKSIVGINDPKIKKFKKEIEDLEKRLGYIGYSKDQMKKACRPFTKRLDGFMKEAVKIAYDYDEEDAVFSKYAAYVPHLMIYPGHVPVPYRNVSKIKIN